MTDEYAAWIAENVDGDGYGGCDHATHDMVLAFPELRRVAGYYYCWVWGRRQHWWCVTQDGQVVDPTAAQFPSAGNSTYEELDPEKDRDRIPTGVCMDCGDPVYKDNTFCSRTCESATMADLGMQLNPKTGNWRTR